LNNLKRKINDKIPLQAIPQFYFSSKLYFSPQKMASYSFIQSKTDIQNFFGNSTYMSLLEHLKELHPKEVQAFVLEKLHIYGNSKIGMLKMGMMLQGQLQGQQ